MVLSTPNFAQRFALWLGYFWEMLFLRFWSVCLSPFLSAVISPRFSLFRGRLGQHWFFWTLFFRFGISFLVHGLAVFPVAKVVVFQFLQPLAGALSPTLWWERFTPWLFVGGALTMCGVWLVNRR